jgi:hypothetical protein
MSQRANPVRQTATVVRNSIDRHYLLLKLWLLLEVDNTY